MSEVNTALRDNAFEASANGAVRRLYLAPILHAALCSWQTGNVKAEPKQTGYKQSGAGSSSWQDWSADSWQSSGYGGKRRRKH